MRSLLRPIARWLWPPTGEDDRARQAAIRHFETSTGAHAIESMCWVVGRRRNELIVRICHGDTTPPRRRWFAVPRAGNGQIRELTLEEAQEFVEPVWR